MFSKCELIFFDCHVFFSSSAILYVLQLVINWNSVRLVGLLSWFWHHNKSHIVRLSAMVWKSPLRMVWRHAITILIFHERVDSPTLIAQRSGSEVEHLAVSQINEYFTPSHSWSFWKQALSSQVLIEVRIVSLSVS